MVRVDTIYANASRAKGKGVMPLVLLFEKSTSAVEVSANLFLCAQVLSAQENGKSF